MITAFLLIGGLLFIGLGGGLILVVRSERLARKVGQWAERAIGAVLRRLGRKVPDVQGALVRFRVTLGDTVRARGLGAFIVAMASKFAWVLLMIVSMRVVGVSAKTLPDAIIMAGVAAVFVITVLPISPGGAGVPELLYISFFTAYTGGADSSAISAGGHPVPGVPVGPADPVRVGPAGHLAARQVAPADHGRIPGRRAGTGSRRRLTVGQPSAGASVPARTSPDS